MALNNTKALILAELLQKEYRPLLTYNQLFNNKYQQDIGNVGDSLKINILGDISASDWDDNNPASEVDYPSLDTSALFLQIEYSKNISFQISDTDEVQSSIKTIFSDATEKAAFTMAQEWDSYLRGKLLELEPTTGLGTVASPITVGKATGTDFTITEYLTQVALELDRVNCSRNGRKIIVSPEFVQALVLEGVSILTSNGDIATSGSIGFYCGFEIICSTLVQHTGGAGFRIFAGTDDASTEVSQIKRPEIIRLEKRYSDGFRMLHVGGAKITRPGAVISSVVTITND